MEVMADTVWTAAELEGLTAAEQDEVFAASLIRDPTTMPTDFLERVRERTRRRIAENETQDR
jgi:hypothetical protein